MGKLESNKQQKRTSLLDTAFKSFINTGGIKTSIAEISQKAGIAKGTFYLYFKDKYDIRNKLISHEQANFSRMLLQLLTGTYMRRQLKMLLLQSHLLIKLYSLLTI